MAKYEKVDFKAVDKIYHKVLRLDRNEDVSIKAGILVDVIHELKNQKFSICKLGAQQAEERMKTRPQRVKVLRKSDSTLGWMYVCSNCKHFVCHNTCAHCGAELDYSDIEDYTGKVEWEREEE